MRRILRQTQKKLNFKEKMLLKPLLLNQEQCAHQNQFSSCAESFSKKKLISLLHSGALCSHNPSLKTRHHRKGVFFIFILYTQSTHILFWARRLGVGGVDRRRGLLLFGDDE